MGKDRKNQSSTEELEKDIININDVNKKENKKEDSYEGLYGTMDKETLEGPVSRKEFIDVLKQITDNINDMSNYVMEDMNTLYSTHIFPYQMYTDILKELVIKNNLATEEELIKMYNDRIKDLLDRAKEINEDGTLKDNKENKEDKEESKEYSKEDKVVSIDNNVN